MLLRLFAIMNLRPIFVSAIQYSRERTLLMGCHLKQTLTLACIQTFTDQFLSSLL